MRKQSLVIDEKVEVRSTDDGFLGSWHSGTVISLEKGIRLVQYDHLLSDSNDKLVESVNVNNVVDGFDCMLVIDCCFRNLIRPVSPLIDFDLRGVEYGQCVDVYYLDAWWEGVIFDRRDGEKERSVFFPDLGDELRAEVGCMRVSQDWDECSGDWKVRGKWLLLELIDELEKCWPVVVSIKQIWYDIRVKQGFVENVKEWTCLRSDVWRGLLEEVIVDNFKLTVKELYRELEVSGVKGLGECYQILELSGSELYDLIKSEPAGVIGGDEPVENVGLHMVPLSSSVEGVENVGLDMVPLSSSVEGEAQCVSPSKIAAMDSNVDDELYKDGSCAKNDEFCNNSRKGLKKINLNVWYSADLAPRSCEDAIKVYLKCQASMDRIQIPHKVTVNLRRHLLYLGWKVEYIQKEGFRRWRYTQPDGTDKFNSLVKVCEQIGKSDFAEVSQFPSEEKNKSGDAVECEVSLDQYRLRDVDDPVVLTPLAKTSQGCQSELLKDSQGMLEYEYCPQAVISYYSLEFKKTAYPKHHDLFKDMQVKAKKHLSAVGWKFYIVLKNGRKKELRYRAPWGKVFLSLRSACKGYLDENRKVCKLADMTDKQQHQNNEEEDDLCSVCHSDGTLILCDRCPSAFHSRCVGLKEDPCDAVWFCPSCCCRICGAGENSCDSEVSAEYSFVNCDQCARQYHISCLKKKEIVPDSYPIGCWFCNKKCEQISFALKSLLGKPVQVGTNGLTWTLLRYVNPEESVQSDIGNLKENDRKLKVALRVMLECFVSVKEPRTRSDIVEDVIYNRGSRVNRLNYRGFYTVLLEKNDKSVSAATVRIYGEKVAELPFVATRFRYRRQGMCHILLNELEKLLRELGVERLVLPAIPEMLDTWTSSFGFSVMPQSDRLKLLDYTLINFPGTTMCQKLLSKNHCIESSPRKTIEQHCGVANRNDNVDLGNSSTVIVGLPAVQVLGQRSKNRVRGSRSRANGVDRSSGLVSHCQTTGFKLIPSQSKITLKSSVDETDCKEDENRGNGKITCSKRRKIAKPVEGVAC
ncbi:uncharacterized protein LOC108196726 [Daucus carota subsp. sativus]|uniref:uncharacterized protein LOC108196726 n=1 Tax=Daucus carota subsp. sativus TaxID=79200 RepID=UPI003083A1CD